MSPAREPLTSTYRLQLHGGFTLDDAREALPVVADLGISHVYLSPITRAAPGSTHGYDVVDPTEVNPELGGEDAYWRFVEEQHRLGLGQILDIVPNHMGIAPGSGNAWWEDVLRHGRDSKHAPMFDIDWASAGPDTRIVIPFLGEPLDALLARGDIEVISGADDHPRLRVGGIDLPLDPRSVDEWRNAGARGDMPSLRTLLEAQHYRPTFWRDAGATLNYRRFFAIDTLIGVRIEEPVAFETMHRLALRLVREGAVDGLRIDHIDGLYDPQGYLERLRAALDEAGAPDAPILVEKILAAEEPLPEAWACDGTTGYEFMDEVVRVFLDRAGEAGLRAVADEVYGPSLPFEEIAAAGRRHVVSNVLGQQITRAAERLHAALQLDGAHVPDPRSFVEAVRELVAATPVYRTYHRTTALDPRALAVRHARARTVQHDATTILADDALTEPPEGEARHLVMQLQQLMPAVQAKGVEDRALYRHRRHLALNEVGGDPGASAEGVATFHRRMREAARWRSRLLATATHDHKRGEDARMRLVALATFSADWRDLLGTVEPILDQAQRISGTVAQADIYLLLQTIVGSVPLGMLGGREGDGAFEERAADYLVKALREAGERSAWVDGDPEYEERAIRLVQNLLAPGAPLLTVMRPLLERVARLGATLSLGQVVLKVAGPGVTDVYQGNELWDLTLVDPDNRRAVDFALRRELLARLRPLLDDTADEAQRTATLGDLRPHWQSGELKAYVLGRGLHLRRDAAALFLDGDYVPIEVSGAASAHIIAFARTLGEDATIALVPTAPPEVIDQSARSLWHPEWDDTHLVLPPALQRHEWRDVYSGRAFHPDASIEVSAMLEVLPVALLRRTN